MWLKGVARFGLRLSVLLVATFCLLEGALLVFDDWIFRDALWGYDPDLGARVRPHAVYGNARANAFGFNDQDYPLDSPGRFRILILSDSFNWAGARSWNYTVFVRQKLQASFGPRVEVINAGYPGTHSAEQYPVLEKFGMQYGPDIVALGFFAGNDFIDAQPWRKRIGYGGATIDLDLRRDWYALVLGQPVTWRSRFLVNLRARWKARTLQRRAGRMNRAQYLSLVRQRMRFCELAQQERFEPNVRWILDSIAAMKKLVEGEGKKFLVVAYPAEFQVRPRLAYEVAEAYQLDPSGFDLERAQKLLREFCRREGIEFHDFLPAFRSETALGRTLYLPSNTHWNREGNQLAEELLYKILVPKVQSGLQSLSR